MSQADAIPCVSDVVRLSQQDGYRDGALTEQTDYGWACWVWKWRCSCGLAIAFGEGDSVEHARALAESRLADEMLHTPPYRHRDDCVPPLREIVR